jgi:hypothetical protein
MLVSRFFFGRPLLKSFSLEVNFIAGYQVLLQYFLRQLDERPSEAFLTDIDEVKTRRPKKQLQDDECSFQLSASLKRYPSDKVLRLLWAYSQVQYKQPALAVDSTFHRSTCLWDLPTLTPSIILVWFRLMFPLVENRTYNQFVVDNLAQLTTYVTLLSADEQKFHRLLSLV